FDPEEKDLDISHDYLAKDNDMRPIVVRTLLTYLELLGLIEGGTPFYSSYRFQPFLKSKQILAQFHGEKREFIATILSCCRKAQTWFHIDVDYAAGRMAVARQKIIAALDFLDEKGMLNIQSEGVRHRYKLIKAPENKEQLI